MTNYELLEVQAGYIDLLTQAYKFWVTTTFALVAAAYVVGPGLGWPISIGIAALYLALAGGNVGTLRYYQTIAKATQVDLDASGDTSATVQAAAKLPTDGLLPVIMIVLVGGSLGAVVYLFFRVSGLG